MNSRTTSLSELLDRNKKWANDVKTHTPDFFSNLSKQQSPQYLWIGCSDSRVPANQIVGLIPGEIFVHRNVGNIVVHTDFNCLSVLEYAVAILKVKHVIVCGHYGCGGVINALKSSYHGLIDNWLRHIKDVHEKYEADLSKLATEQARLNRLCELNVLQQVHNVCTSSILKLAWKSGQSVSVHGWIYGVDTGLLNDLNVSISSTEETESRYTHAQKALWVQKSQAK